MRKRDRVASCTFAQSSSLLQQARVWPTQTQTRAQTRGEARRLAGKHDATYRTAATGPKPRSALQNSDYATVSRCALAPWPSVTHANIWLCLCVSRWRAPLSVVSSSFDWLDSFRVRGSMSVLLDATSLWHCASATLGPAAGKKAHYVCCGGSFQVRTRGPIAPPDCGGSSSPLTRQQQSNENLAPEHESGPKPE